MCFSFCISCGIEGAVFIAGVIRHSGVGMKFLVTVIGENHAEQMDLYCTGVSITPESSRPLEVTEDKFDKILRAIPADVCPEFSYALYEAQQQKYRIEFKSALREFDPEPGCPIRC